MMHIALGWIGALLLGPQWFLGGSAQTRSFLADYWQAVDKSMTDLLQEGYRSVSFVAPSPQLRVYF
jgi:hypothetical protein